MTPRIPVNQLIQYHALTSLIRNEGNRRATAQELGVCIRTLRNWLRGEWPFSHLLSEQERLAISGELKPLIEITRKFEYKKYDSSKM